MRFGMFLGNPFQQTTSQTPNASESQTIVASSGTRDVK